MNKLFRYTILFILLTELLSFLGHFYPEFGSINFFVVLLIILFLSLQRLEYGLFIVLVELIISSKGYLFSFEAGGISISIRIGIFLVIMSVWLLKVIKTRKVSFYKSRLFLPYILLFIFIASGVINGVLRGNSFNNVFFDVNGFIFLAYIFPFYEVFAPLKKLKPLFSVLSAALLALCVKTFILLFIFTHKMFFLMPDLYKWVRDTGVGEITRMMDGNFYRVFLQSQIYALIGFFVFSVILIWQLKEKKEKQVLKENKFVLLMSIFCLASVLLSYSRSFWVGLLAGGFIFYILIIFYFKFSFKQFLKTTAFFVSTLVLSFILLFIIVKMPFPTGSGEFSAGMLGERAKTVSGEAGVSSRWSLLPPLLEEGQKHLIFGSGFGTTITYKSSDPRVLDSSPEGWYTTYAFEWGYFDTILKMGAIGVAAYLFVILQIWKMGWKRCREDKGFSIALFIGLIALLATNAFSPYLNHPLGIGYIILLSVLFANSTLKIKKEEKEHCQVLEKENR